MRDLKLLSYSPRPVLMASLLLGLLSGTAHGTSVITPVDMIAWERRDFAEPTVYQLAGDTSQPLLQAQCRDGATALYLEQNIDLRKTPVLEWSWMVDDVFTGIDEKQKSGDDYAARLYVVKDGGLLIWRTRAVNYVWASQQPVGANWQNAYASQAQMLALRSGAPGPPTGTFPILVSERRNVRDDFQQLHGVLLDSIDGVAIMTDCDDSGQSATAWYGPMRWLPAAD